MEIETFYVKSLIPKVITDNICMMKSVKKYKIMFVSSSDTLRFWMDWLLKKEDNKRGGTDLNLVKLR